MFHAGDYVECSFDVTIEPCFNHRKINSNRGLIRVASDEECLIEFDHPFAGGHDGNNSPIKIHSCRGWWCLPRDLTLAKTVNAINCESGYAEYKDILAAQELING